MFLKNFKVGTPLMLLETWYERPKKVGNKRVDKLHIMYKHVETGESYLETIENPTVQFYVTKPGIEYKELQPDMKLSDVEVHETEYSNILLYIAKIADERAGTDRYTTAFFNNIRNGDFKRNNLLHQYRYVHSTDVNIEDHYRLRFKKYYHTEDLPIRKAFFDIETDIINSESNIVEDLIKRADAPVNAVTIVFESEKLSYTFLLRHGSNDNPQIEEFEDSDKESFIKEIKDEYSNLIGEYEFKIAFFDEEVELIESIFRLINIVKPDIMLAWNLGFDIKYLINRLGVLGYSEDDIKKMICHKDFHDIAKLYYYEDRNPKHNKFEDKDHWLYCTSYTIYMDQMINYAKVNKGGSQIPSYSLDYISEKDTGKTKLDSGDFATFPYRDYRMFVKYNIVDVLLQVAIEKKSEHLDIIMLRSYNAGTRLSKVFKQSVFLTSYAHEAYPEIGDGYVLGSNHNIKYVDDGEAEDDEKYVGAIVGNPQNNASNGEVVNGTKSKYVYRNTADYDYEAMYPKGRDSHNIDIKTQYGIVLINQEISEMENIYEEEKYNRGGNFLDDFQTQAILTIGSKWFGLPHVDEVIEEILADTCEVDNKPKKSSSNNIGLLIELKRPNDDGIRKLEVLI